MRATPLADQAVIVPFGMNEVRERICEWEFYRSFAPQCGVAQSVKYKRLFTVNRVKSGR
jgi:hypothetical protein